MRGETRVFKRRVAVAVVMSVGLLSLMADSEDGTGPPTVVAVNLTPAQFTLTGASDTATVSATALDAAGKPVANVSFTWSTSNPAVATVTPRRSQGLVTAVAPGIAVVSARTGSVTGSSQVIVTPK